MILLFCCFSFANVFSLTTLFRGQHLFANVAYYERTGNFGCQTGVFCFGGNNQGMQLQANTQIDIHYIEISDWSHFQYATNMHADMVVWYEFTCMCVCVCIFDEYPNVFMSVGMDG